jgi:hypothetical protein
MASVLAVRELYCPSHFGNTYEVALNHEMREILAEGKFWGFNRFSDWFDTIDLYNVYKKKHHLFNMPEAMWARKFSNFEIASDLGYQLGLVITPNHVFSDQVTAANEAVRNDHIFGQLVCPSKPGGTELILENYRNLFADFAKRNLGLQSISACPYDYGGCVCETCKPWIVTFGKLVKQIVEMARGFFGRVDADLLGWWWSDEDHRDFTAWADREASGFFNSMAYYLPYGVTDYAPRPVPEKCSPRAFVHICYSGYAENGNDSYGHFGPTIAPDRLEKTYRYLVANNTQGFLAYSEGAFDEINKAVLGGLSSGQYETAGQVLEAYAQKYLGGDAPGWAAWIALMAHPEENDLVAAGPEFDRLSQKARSGWRLQQLHERLNMFQADKAVRAQPEWNGAKMEAAKSFWEAKERLFRQVWRFGLLRHIFRFEHSAPDWSTEYFQLKGKKIEDNRLSKLDEA